MEEWRKLDKYKRIEVSNLGNVRTVWPHKVKNLKPTESKTTVGTYLTVPVKILGEDKFKSVGVHNLVAEAFVEIPVDKRHLNLEPNHRDGNKHNNCDKNLEWMTRRENLQHAIDTGLRKLVDANGRALYVDKSKPVKVLDHSTQKEVSYGSAKDASLATGIPVRTVQYNAFYRKNKKPVKGFIFTSE
jgi:hypothetical protein